MGRFLFDPLKGRWAIDEMLDCKIIMCAARLLDSGKLVLWLQRRDEDVKYAYSEVMSRLNNVRMEDILSRWTPNIGERRPIFVKFIVVTTVVDDELEEMRQPADRKYYDAILILLNGVREVTVDKVFRLSIMKGDIAINGLMFVLGNVKDEIVKDRLDRWAVEHAVEIRAHAYMMRDVYYLIG